MARADLRRVALIAALRIGSVMLVALAWLGAVQDSALAASHGEMTTNAVALLPQGWAFFTRDPREERVTAWIRRGDGWEVVDQRGSSLSAFMGLRRSASVLGVELGTLAAKLPEERWVAAADPRNPTATGATLPPMEVRDDSVAPRLCGDLVLSKAEPVPWAWSRSRTPVPMPTRVARATVVCP